MLYINDSHPQINNNIPFYMFIRNLLIIIWHSAMQRVIPILLSFLYLSIL